MLCVCSDSTCSDSCKQAWVLDSRQSSKAESPGWTSETESFKNSERQVLEGDKSFSQKESVKWRTPVQEVVLTSFQGKLATFFNMLRYMSLCCSVLINKLFIK